MARDYAKINIAIWQDDDWRDLPAPAQHLYFTLWTHPHLNYAGVLDWRPGRIAGMAGGWEEKDLRAAADCLRSRLFIVTDDDTEECLIRSFVRFDGLMKQPRLAVSFFNAFAGTTSSSIRGVIVHEAAKLRQEQPDLAAWDKPQVQELLSKRDINPRGLPLPIDPFGGDLGHGFGDRFAHSADETAPTVTPKASVPASVPPTTATTTTPLLHPVPDADTSAPKPSRKRPSTPLPDGWKPNDKHREEAQKLSIDLNHQADRFRNWALSKDTRYANWDAAFTNWIKNAKPTAAKTTAPKDQLPW